MINAIRITDMYMSVLSSLTSDEKLDLIAKLSDSMRKKKTVARSHGLEVFACFHEDWGGDESPETISDKLRSSRQFVRDIEEW